MPEDPPRPPEVDRKTGKWNRENGHRGGWNEVATGVGRGQKATGLVNQLGELVNQLQKGGGFNGSGSCLILASFLDLILQPRSIWACTGNYVTTGPSRHLCTVEAYPRVRE